MTLDEMYSIIKKMPLEKQILVLAAVNFLIAQSKPQQKLSYLQEEP